jgi:hypothetical protein
MNAENEIRDAVIKLETKMEVMTESMISMASSVSKLADLRYEVLSIKKDVDTLDTRVLKNEKSIDILHVNQITMEKVQVKNSYIIGKVDIFWTALITGAAAFVWWLVKT